MVEDILTFPPNMDLSGPQMSALNFTVIYYFQQYMMRHLIMHYCLTVLLNQEDLRTLK